jgi:hypothetical protein
MMSVMAPEKDCLLKITLPLVSRFVKHFWGLNQGTLIGREGSVQLKKITIASV